MSEFLLCMSSPLIAHKKSLQKKKSYKSFLMIALARHLNDSSSCVCERRTDGEWMSYRMSDEHQSRLIKLERIEFVNGSQAELLSPSLSISICISHWAERAEMCACAPHRSAALEFLMINDPQTKHEGSTCSNSFYLETPSHFCLPRMKSVLRNSLPSHFTVGCFVMTKFLCLNLFLFLPPSLWQVCKVKSDKDSL